MDLGLKDRVFVIAADGADQAACAAALRAEGATIVAAPSLDAAPGAVAQALSAHGRVDGAVMYLPIHAKRTVLDLDVDGLYERWAAVEAISAAFLAAVPSMTERSWGRLVSVISSGAKWIGGDIDEADALVSLGVLGMNKCAVADLARSNIAVNAVLRGPASTPAEIAGAAAFLVSDSAGYLHGVTISLDGAKSPAMF